MRLAYRIAVALAVMPLVSNLAARADDTRGSATPAAVTAAPPSASHNAYVREVIQAWQVEDLIETSCAIANPRDSSCWTSVGTRRSVAVDLVVATVLAQTGVTEPIALTGPWGAPCPSRPTLAIAKADLIVPAGPFALVIQRELGGSGIGLLGTDWRLNWESKLERRSDGYVVTKGTRQITFATHGSDFVAPGGERLVVNASDGTLIRIRGDLVRDGFDTQGRLAWRDYGRQNRATLRYNASGQLDRIDGPFGSFVALTFDQAGHVVRIDGSDGESASYSYQGADLVTAESATGPAVRYSYDVGHLSRIDDPASGAVAFTYDAQGRLTTQQWADGSTEQWDYDDVRQVVSCRDRRGAITTWQTSSDGLREIRNDPDGTRVTIDRDQLGRPIAIDAGLGGFHVAEGLDYDDLGRLAAVLPSSSRIFKFSYEGPSALLADIVTPTGEKITFSHGAAGELAAVRVDNELVAALAFTQEGLIAARGLLGQALHKFEYDAHGRLAAIVDSLGRRRRFDYDQYGLLAHRIEPTGESVAYTYDAKGRRHSETDPAGTVKYAYDSAGRLVSSTGRDGAHINYAFDALGRRAVVADSTGRRSTETIDPSLNSAIETIAGFGTIHRSYDRLGRLVEIIDQYGIATRYRYDSQGHLAQVSDDLGSTLTYQYDAAGHLVTIDNGRGSVRRFAWSGQSIIAEMEPTGGIVGFGTDPFGRIASIVDPAGGETQYAYDAGDRLLSARAPSGDVVRFEYAREGQLATIWHPSGNATRLQRDVGGRVTMVTQPDGAVFRHAYDKAGKRVMVTDPAGRQLEFAYDPAGRLVSKKLPGVVVKYKYNSDGELIEADDGLLPVKRSVDKNGRITAVNWPRLRLRLALAYDDRGRVSNFTGSAGQKLHYTYDRASRVAGIVLPDGSEIAFAYDSDSRVQEVHFPNGVQGNYIYTADGAIASLAWKDAGDHTLASWIYGRDSRGNVTGVDRGTGAPPLAYGYDADGRLIEEHTGKQPVRYEYLPGGDRAVRQESTISTKYGYEKDRLVTAGDERLDYDQSGNIVGREAKAGVTHYDYDAEGRLTKATTPEGTRVTYAYDALGQLLARHDDLGTVYRLQYGGNLIEEVSPTRTSIAFYVYAPGIDHPLAMVRDGKTYFYQSDGLGSIALLTDAAGKIVARYETDAFGRLLSPLPDVANPFIFAGREYEPALHLYFNRARWYDPALGRFLSPDPFLGRPDNPETFNRYVYALNAPTRYRDPLGLDEIPVDSNGESPGAPLTKSSPPITRASPQLNADQARQAAVAAFDEAYR